MIKKHQKRVFDFFIDFPLLLAAVKLFYLPNPIIRAGRMKSEGKAMMGIWIYLLMSRHFDLEKGPSRC
jgi:hypothetical protein